MRENREVLQRSLKELYDLIYSENMLYYVTSNKSKIDTARRNLTPFGITFQTQDAELIEIQSDSLEEIAVEKAKHAFKLFQKPLFISDHGWYIPALHGFPGPYMKYINKWFTSEDLLRLVEPYEDRTIIKREVLVYIDSQESKTFVSEINGRILEKPEGNGLPAMRVTTLSKTGKSMARCSEEGINAFDENPIYEEFAFWLHTTKQLPK